VAKGEHLKLDNEVGRGDHSADQIFDHGIQIMLAASRRLPTAMRVRVGKA